MIKVCCSLRNAIQLYEFIKTGLKKRRREFICNNLVIPYLSLFFTQASLSRALSNGQLFQRRKGMSNSSNWAGPKTFRWCSQLHLLHTYMPRLWHPKVFSLGILHGGYILLSLWREFVRLFIFRLFIKCGSCYHISIMYLT